MASPPASQREERNRREATAGHYGGRRNADIEIDGRDFRVVAGADRLHFHEFKISQIGRDQE
jgi:hypothetical protein